MACAEVIHTNPVKVPPPCEPSAEPPALGTTAHPVAGPAHTGRMSRPEGSQWSGGFGGRERSGGQQRSRCYVLKFGVFSEVESFSGCLLSGPADRDHPAPRWRWPSCLPVLRGGGAESHGLGLCAPARLMLCLSPALDTFPRAHPRPPFSLRHHHQSGPGRAQDPRARENKCLVAPLGQAGRARTSESVALSAR